MMLRWSCKAVQGQRESLQAVTMMDAPSSWVVFIQGMQNDADREPSRKLVNETL